jgi:hypothetical protein
MLSAYTVAVGRAAGRQMPHDSATAITLAASTRRPNQGAAFAGEAQCVGTSDVLRKEGEGLALLQMYMPVDLEALHRHSSVQVLFLTSEIDRPGK